jgi:hypothetical protein
MSWLRCLLAAWVLALPQPALAHKASDSYLTINAEDSRLTGQWDIALRDLELVLGLDADSNGEITWGEVKSRHQDIAGYALSRLRLSSEGQPCDPVATGHLIDHHSDGAYAVLRFEARCHSPVTALDIHYRLLFDLDPQHKGLLNFSAAGIAHTGVFSPEQPALKLSLVQPSHWHQFLDYLRHGSWHIWIGYDHILFLISLLLPAVLVHVRGGWEPLGAFRPAFWEVFRIVTAFTVAHSITLSLAALGHANLPSRFVESAIALSIILAAANNLRPVVLERRWLVAFGFGLVHGFGFASVLADLGLPRDTLVLALVGFNVGVELGQLAIVGVFLPLAYWCRQTVFYQRGVFFAGSLLIVAVALAWFLERAFDLKLMPF